MHAEVMHNDRFGDDCPAVEGPVVVASDDLGDGADDVGLVGDELGGCFDVLCRLFDLVEREPVDHGTMVRVGHCGLLGERGVVVPQGAQSLSLLTPQGLASILTHLG